MDRILDEATPALAAELQFLSSPAAYDPAATEVAVKETHMSYVFLTQDRVYKLKKPVCRPPLDLTTLAARKSNCDEEVRLNRRLAPGLYLGTVALTRSDNGKLALAGEGEVIDWLVVMRRLPEDLMLDRRLEQNDVRRRELTELAELLTRFYSQAARPKVGPDDYLAHIRAQHSENLAMFRRRFNHFDSDAALGVGARIGAAISHFSPALRRRAETLVEGHGDLRPEHICFNHPIVIFDCLEFSLVLRTIDPFDELAYLGLECAVLACRQETVAPARASEPDIVRASEFGPQLIIKVAADLGERPNEALLALYTALRAELRARLVLAHLLDPVPREESKWAPLAETYLRLARDSLARLDMAL